MSGAAGGAVNTLVANAQRDEQPQTMIAVTDRRIPTADTGDFLHEGEPQGDIPRDQVRHVRLAPATKGHDHAVSDLTAYDENLRWCFPVLPYALAGADFVAAGLLWVQTLRKLRPN